MEDFCPEVSTCAHCQWVWELFLTAARPKPFTTSSTELANTASYFPLPHAEQPGLVGDFQPCGRGVELDDPEGLLQPKPFYDSTKEAGEGGICLSTSHPILSHSILLQLIPDHPAPLLNTILYKHYTYAFPFSITIFHQIFHN